jgi:hypothetical protein
MILSLFVPLFSTLLSFGATIAIIDTGFDLDHDYLKPKILHDTENIDLSGQYFFDNSHLKKRVVEDSSSIQEILLYRNLKAKGHKQGLTVEEFDWFNKKTIDKPFMEKVKLFKRHSHGTFVAGIALREGDNINIFPIRGLNIPNPVVAIQDHTQEGIVPPKGKTSEEKFQDEVSQSLERISKKFSKICRLIAQKKISIVNASYGITYKNIMSKFRERYKDLTGNEIDEIKLKLVVDQYFQELFSRGEKVIKKYPNTLFIFSAGNSGIDNDLFHHYPSKIKADNTITVAAMNGEYLATFSNFGFKHVDIGAPGVAILSLVPKVYSEDGIDLYSPSSGTSMAAPYVANLAAQIKNTNPNLSAVQIRKIILLTGEQKEHLKSRLSSGAMVDNQKALRAAFLSKDFNFDEAIYFGSSGLIPIEDKISIGTYPVTTPEEAQKKVMETIPRVISPDEVDEEPTVSPITENSLATKSSSSLSTDQEKGPQDNLVPPPSATQALPEKSSDPIPSNQSEELSPKPSEEKSPLSSESQSQLPETQSPDSLPSSPKL